MGVTLFSRRFIESHYTQTAALKAVHKGENVAHFLLNIEGDVLQPAEVEKRLESEFFDGWVFKKREEEGVTVLGNECS